MNLFVNQIKVMDAQKVMTTLPPPNTFTIIHYIYIHRGVTGCSEFQLKNLCLMFSQLKGNGGDCLKNSLMWMNGKNVWKTLENLNKWVLVVLVGENGREGCSTGPGAWLHWPTGIIWSMPIVHCILEAGRLLSSVPKSSFSCHVYLGQLYVIPTLLMPVFLYL